MSNDNEGFRSPFEEVVRAAGAPLEAPVVKPPAVVEIVSLELDESSPCQLSLFSDQPTYTDRIRIIPLDQSARPRVVQDEKMQEPGVKGGKKLLAGLAATALAITLGAALSNRGDTTKRETINSVATTTTTPVETTAVTITESATTTPATINLTDFGPVPETTVAETTTTLAVTTTTDTVAPTTVEATVITDPATTLPEQTAPVSLYADVVCDPNLVDSVTIKHGMTMGELEDHCGISAAKFAEYNQGFNPDTDIIIAGQVLYIKPSSVTHVQPVEQKVKCNSPDTLTKIAAGFTVQKYLSGLGYTQSQIDSLVYRSSLREDYALEILTAGNNECLPATSSIAPYLEQ